MEFDFEMLCVCFLFEMLVFCFEFVIVYYVCWLVVCVGFGKIDWLLCCDLIFWMELCDL